ncbi:protein-glutamate methylesterase/protein-glutamine glutaminase [Stakelama tenebrarum]|uniref:Protein-glutamate methylesterase/protein-glutamine glutaminase n=1 Tax=Stakelama tenebrarum TaxID=2711215 RepID=A0A6G6Y4S1_9SPHN|nr:chemotaxis response regulator protein-glutamate methylesterase [Sphingosinithalassobacter tenebrarum]QIG79718.1 chemotaxis response regulator protein-glutamate methylesterase [Sphingosinithalassobacter tenebrarum]
MTRPVRTLIVDDSASMRATLKRILSADPEIEVVGMAPEPFSAREMIKSLDPDVLTLDVEMPGMDGLSFLEKIMRLRPMPVVMCSTLTARGAAVTIEALRLGAVDYVTKPSGTPEDIARDAELLCTKVKSAARAAVRAGPNPLPRAVSSKHGMSNDAVIGIGSSTGGVEALFSLLPALPEDCPPVLIVQHMPATFTRSFAERLDKDCAVHVAEATDGAIPARGTVYIAPGSQRHMELANGRIRLKDGDPVGGHRPSVDILFRSLVPLGSAAVGVILTGMGMDGARGLMEMRSAGAHTFAQSRDSCVVWGMPRAALEIGAVEKELSLSAMPEAILAACRTHSMTGNV